MKKWTPEQRQKYSATMAAKRAEREREQNHPHRSHHRQPKVRPKNNNSNSQHDAIIYLRHARKEIMKQMRQGHELDSGHLYTLLALKALQQEE